MQQERPRQAGRADPSNSLELALEDAPASASAWGLEFTARHQPADAVGEGGSEQQWTPGITTLRVALLGRPAVSTTFFLPAPFLSKQPAAAEQRRGAGERGWLRLSRQRRENGEVDVLLAVAASGEGAATRYAWLTELPRARRLQLLRQFRLPPLYAHAVLMAPDGVGAAKSFLHFLACEASSTQRAQLMKSHGGGSLSHLLQTQPALMGLLVAKDSNGRTPLAAFLRAESGRRTAAGADQAFFLELMAACSLYAGACFRARDATGLMLIMGQVAQLMPDISALELDMTPVWCALPPVWPPAPYHNRLDHKNNSQSHNQRVTQVSSHNNIAYFG